MTAAPSNTALDTVQALQHAPSVLKIKEILRKTASQHGFEYFLCAAAPPAHGEVDEGHALIEEWPDDWRRLYTHERLFANDPVVAKMQCTNTPFLWTSVTANKLCRTERTVMDKAASFGMREGIVIPMFDVGGTAYGASFAGPAPRCDTIASAELHLVSMYACSRAKQLRLGAPGPAVTLTPREREAMQWAAAGKSDWEIGELVGVSESAAHKRIESAKRKYGVTTRIQAIVEALKHGHIQL